MVNQTVVEARFSAVFPVLTNRPTVGGPHTNSTVVAETTGTFSADALDPGSLRASFFYRDTDAARFPGLDAALRQALSSGLSEAVDAGAHRSNCDGRGTDGRGPPKTRLPRTGPRLIYSVSWTGVTLRWKTKSGCLPDRRRFPTCLESTAATTLTIRRSIRYGEFQAA